MKGDLCNELLASAALLCQVDVDLRALPAAPILLTTDASSTAEASASTFVPPRAFS